MVYLDYAATTPVDDRVIEVMTGFLGVESCFANPASRSHMLGWQAEAAVEKARKQIASSLNCDVREIVWTSGATESNNLAIKGALEALAVSGDKRRHLITSATEHKAVLDCVHYLETKGYSVSLVAPDQNGVVSASDVEALIRPDTAIVSIMHVNNEIGSINPVHEIAALCRSHGVVFHSDCAQSAGKLPLDLQVLDADLVSISAHKVYGPKGIGALFVRRRDGFSIAAQIHGGGHERGMRSGTLATHQIAGFGMAVNIACQERQQAYDHQESLKARFLSALEDGSYRINGALEATVPGIVNLTFPGRDGQTLLTALPELAISSGSACNSASMAPSHVLKALGLSDQEALSALRFSFGRFTTVEEVDKAAGQLRHVLASI